VGPMLPHSATGHAAAGRCVFHRARDTKKEKINTDEREGTPTLEARSLNWLFPYPLIAHLGGERRAGGYGARNTSQ
jgi:hypothetical protein